MITVRLPSMLHAEHGTLDIHDPVGTIGELVEAIDRQLPGFRDQVNDPVFNFAINDEMVLFRAWDRVLRDGDVVEVVPAISGGSPERPPDGGRHRVRARPR